MWTSLKIVAAYSAVAALPVAIAVTLMCTSLSQHCHYHCCHSAVLVFAATALCTSVSNRCGIPPEYTCSFQYSRATKTLCSCSSLGSSSQILLQQFCFKLQTFSRGAFSVADPAFWNALPLRPSLDIVLSPHRT